MAGSSGKNMVNVWEEGVVIPTYTVGRPEKNPIFPGKRVYQGSSGDVYPYPVIEKIHDEKINKKWQAMFLENQYLKIMILPELGGRIHMAFDKIKDRHFIYYNRVIKPALVGLTGPWISGGIEFNWPQHHRPSTFEPVDYKIVEDQDGNKTVWCSEVERMSRTRGMTGFRLYPDKAYLEIEVKLYNRTPHPQTFLWWANPALCVNEHYQSVFPPDVHAVFDHGKRDVSTFPVATGTYYKVDYSSGVDISRYKNIPVPTSYMAITSKYDFVGGYEHDSGGGMIHVADHHISPGKKQWTWGNGDFGHAWDRNLTDEDGPYVELMCGVYTDNQPDFSWLMPGEEKTFKQYFMPYRDLGLVKNATREAMLNLEIEKNKANIRVYATANYPGATIRLSVQGRQVFEGKFNLSPQNVFANSIEIQGAFKPEEIVLSVHDESGRELVSWQHEKTVHQKIPDPARAVKEPGDISDNEQLYLAGQHLEQYRHATYDPTLYYREALKRNNGDARSNNAMGLWLLRRGQFKKAERHFRRSLKTLTERNPNPYDGESYYQLGIALTMQEKYEDAYDAFYKATWNAAWQDTSFFELARISCMRSAWDTALEQINHSLARNSANHRGIHLKVAIMRKLGEKENILGKISSFLRMDPFNFGLYFEHYLLTGIEEKLSDLRLLIRKNIHNYIEIALDYAHAGMFDEAIQLIQTGIRDQTVTINPMAFYYLGWFAHRNGNQNDAIRYIKKAALQSPDYCFPNRIECIAALNYASLSNPLDARCRYYLGNFWYANRQYEEAIECWEKSKNLDESYPTVLRNLSLAYYNRKKDPVKALQELEKAFWLDPKDARILFELDELYKRLNKPVKERLELLEMHPEEVDQRDDLYLERITMLNLISRHEKALELIMSRKFHPWEGGEGKVTGQYLTCHIELAKRAILSGGFAAAIEHLKATEQFPQNLGEGKLYGVQENDINYWFGIVYKGMGNLEHAMEYWEKASIGLSEPTSTFFYNDQPPDNIFYQGQALMALDRKKEASERFRRLVEYGVEHMDDDIKIDYFAISLPDLLIWDTDLKQKNIIHCNYMISLGYLGMGELEKARKKLLEILNRENHHQGARIHMQMMEEHIPLLL